MTTAWQGSHGPSCDVIEWWWQGVAYPLVVVVVVRVGCKKKKELKVF